MSERPGASGSAAKLGPAERRRGMQKRAEETREAIVAVAAELFAGQGYAATSLRDITSRLGLTLGALYFHFGSKHSLAVEIVRRQHAESIGAVQLIENAKTSAIESIVLLSRVLAEQARDSSVVRAGLRLSTESVDDFAGVVSTPYREWVHAGCLLLERARAQGEIRPELDVGSTAEVIVGAFSGTQFLAAALGRDERLSSMLASMWALLLPGILADSDDPVLERVRELLGVL